MEDAWVGRRCSGSWVGISPLCDILNFLKIFWNCSLKLCQCPIFSKPCGAAFDCGTIVTCFRLVDRSNPEHIIHLIGSYSSLVRCWITVQCILVYTYTVTIMTPCLNLHLNRWNIISSLFPSCYVTPTPQSNCKSVSTFKCDQLINTKGVFGRCIAVLDPKTVRAVYDSCLYDLLQTCNESWACPILEGFVGFCHKTAGVSIQWRDKLQCRMNTHLLILLLLHLCFYDHAYNKIFKSS